MTEFQATQIFENFFPDYMGIPILLPPNYRKFNGKIFFATKIHGESHPVSMCIPVMYLMTQYFSCKFSHKPISSETT